MSWHVQPVVRGLERSRGSLLHYFSGWYWHPTIGSMLGVVDFTLACLEDSVSRYITSQTILSRPWVVAAGHEAV